MIQFRCSLIIGETEDDCRLIHIADDIYHNIRKRVKVQRSCRKNHRGHRTVTYTFQNDADANTFMAAVKQSFSDKHGETIPD